MILQETRLTGVYLLESQRHEDERGFFVSLFGRDEFQAHGLDFWIAQCALSFNRRRGTLRGLHYQAEPNEQAKLVRCTRGAIYDVVVDLRPDSPTRRVWVAVELTADSLRSVFVPVGFAHGFLTLGDDTEVCYMLSTPQVPESERGLRWNDPALAIDWPMGPAVISPRDRDFPLLGSSK